MVDKLNTQERSKIRRFLIYLYQNNKYDNEEYRTNKKRLLECIDLVESESIFKKKDALDLRLFLDSAVIDFKETRIGSLINDSIFKSAYNKIFKMYLSKS